MTRYAPRGSYPSARSLACSFADGDRWICALKESGRPVTDCGASPMLPAARSAAARPEAELPDDSCTAHRPTRVDGHLAALHRARPEAKKRSCALCPGMM
jgi:hypothetical protein